MRRLVASGLGLKPDVKSGSMGDPNGPGAGIGAHHAVMVLCFRNDWGWIRLTSTHFSIRPFFLEILLSTITLSLSLSACVPPILTMSSYAYSRVDLIYIDGVLYSSEINSVEYFETGFSPDLGSQRVNVTRQKLGARNVYEIRLKDGSGLWIFDNGPQDAEQKLLVGSTLSSSPYVVRVDNPERPTHFHRLTTVCSRDMEHKECLEDTKFTILASTRKNLQPLAPIESDYARIEEGEKIRVYAEMKYSTCDKSDWIKNKRLYEKYSSKLDSVRNGERNMVFVKTGNWYPSCNTNANVRRMKRLDDEKWEITDDRADGSETDYVGTIQYRTYFSSDMFFLDMNSRFFKNVVLMDGMQVLQMPEDGASAVFYNPIDQKLYFFGQNSFPYFHFVR